MFTHSPQFTFLNHIPGTPEFSFTKSTLTAFAWASYPCKSIFSGSSSRADYLGLLTPRAKKKLLLQWGRRQSLTIKGEPSVIMGKDRKKLRASFLSKPQTLQMSVMGLG